MRADVGAWGDAGPSTDAGTSDAGFVDGGARDGGARDSGVLPRDGGPRDSGVLPRDDGGPRDGGVLPRDGGPRDGGVLPRDGGARDGGVLPRDGGPPARDGGVADSGVLPDAGALPDAGLVLALEPGTLVPANYCEDGHTDIFVPGFPNATFTRRTDLEGLSYPDATLTSTGALTLRSVGYTSSTGLFDFCAEATVVGVGSVWRCWFAVDAGLSPHFMQSHVDRTTPPPPAYPGQPYSHTIALATTPVCPWQLGLYNCDLSPFAVAYGANSITITGGVGGALDPTTTPGTYACTLAVEFTCPFGPCYPFDNYPFAIDVVP